MIGVRSLGGARHWLTLASAIALTIVSDSRTVRAACAQVASAITCTGTTTNFDAGTQSGITATVQSSATVLGTGGFDAFRITNPSGVSADTVTNNGTIDGTVVILSSAGGLDSFTNSGLLTISDPGIGATHSLAGANFIQTTGGTLAIRFDAAGNNDFVLAFTATLNGKLLVVVQPGLYTSPLSYSSVVTTFAGVTGSFSSVVSSSPFFTVSAVYTVGSADVTLTRIPFGSVPGMTDNQRAVGNTLEANYSPGVTGNAATLYSNLFAATSVSALDQLSGAGTSATQGAAFLMNNAFMGLLGQGGMFGGGNGTGAGPLGYASAETRGHPAVGIIKIRPQDEIAHRWQTWVAGFGATRSVDGDAAAGTFANTQRGGGAAAGLVNRSDPDLALGAAIGVSQSHFAVNDLSTSGDLTTAHLGVHAAKRWDALYATAAIAYARIDSDTTRIIAGVGPTEIAKGRFAGDLLAGRMEIGWRHDLGRYALTPFAAVQFSELWQRGYSETSSTLGGGPGVLGLSYASQAISSLPITLGAQIDSRFALESGLSLTPYARLAWLHEFRPDSRIDASFVSIPGTSFTVAGARSASDAARIDSGLRLALNERAALTAGFTGELSAHSQAYAGTGGLQVSW